MISPFYPYQYVSYTSTVYKGFLQYDGTSRRFRDVRVWCSGHFHVFVRRLVCPMDNMIRVQMCDEPMRLSDVGLIQLLTSLIAN